MYYLFLYRGDDFIITFQEWCINNNHQDYLDLWDYELNELTPDKVSHQTHKKYYFKCNNHYNHPSELKRLDNIVHQPHSVDCKICQSLGWYMEQNNLLSYWDYDKNEIDPYDINAQANKKVWIKCLKNYKHPSYEIGCNHFYEGNRCPYCAGKKVILEESIKSVNPNVNMIWSDKNTKRPEEYTSYSNKLVWWKCENGIHEDFCRSIAVMNIQNFHCPMCSNENKSSYLQMKVDTYLKELGYTANHEIDCTLLPKSLITGRNLPYDNEIPELKLIIEVNGLQHYNPDSCSWYKHGAKRDNISLEEYIQKRQYYDDYKQEYALKHGYSFLIIPYWAEKNDEYKILIDEKIKEIVQAEEL